MKTVKWTFDNSWTSGFFYIHHEFHRPISKDNYYGFTLNILPAIEVRHSDGSDDGRRQTIIEFKWLLWGWQVCFNFKREINFLRMFVPKKSKAGRKG